MFKVFDSCGRLVRSGFHSYQDALNYKTIFGNYNWYIL